MSESVISTGNTGTTEITHVLNIDGETFKIYHLNRRLYKFLDWKDAREKLIKIMLKKIENKTGYVTAYIEFKMANPMRKSRLGNFFIDIQADILHSGRSLGTVEELGVKQIFSDSFETLDESELELRSTVEERHSTEQYNKELELRIASLTSMNNDSEEGPLHCDEDKLKGMAKKLMASEGWSLHLDNRIHARKKRLSEI